LAPHLQVMDDRPPEFATPMNRGVIVQPALLALSHQADRN